MARQNINETSSIVCVSVSHMLFDRFFALHAFLECSKASEKHSHKTVNK